MIHDMDLSKRLERRCCGELDVLGDDVSGSRRALSLAGILAQGLMVQARM